MKHKQQLRVLAVDPFLEGSHFDILEGWKAHSRHEITIVGHRSGPWHWRMRHSALSLSRKINDLISKGERWDVIFSTSMLHLGEFISVNPSLSHLPTVVYFHENQLTYPISQDPDPHLVFNQFIGSFSATEIWYNSQFHLEQHHQALRGWLKKMPAPSLLSELNDWKEKCRVVYPGVDLLNARPLQISSSGPLHLLWAARWEEDKNPNDFLSLVRSLLSAGLDLKVTLMGHHPNGEHDLVSELHSLLGPKLMQPGFLEDRANMLALQNETHLLVSTTHHEFFGLSVMESALCGRALCLPRRLSYPELYSHLELHDEGILFYSNLQEATAKIIQYDQLRRRGELQSKDRISFLSKYLWTDAASRFDSLPTHDQN